MPLKHIVLENPDTYSGQIKQLRDLVIDYHHEAPPFLQTWGGLIGTGIIVIVGFFTQWRIFRLNKKKEITLKVADIYGKVRSKSILYRMTLEKLNDATILQNAYSIASFYHSKIYGQEDYFYDEMDDDATDHENEMNKYKAWSGTERAKKEQLDKEHTNQKLELIELLYQIHFYYNDKVLEEYIDKFRGITVLPLNLTIPETEYIKKGFYAKYFYPDVKKQREECKNLFEDYSKRMLKFH